MAGIFGIWGPLPEPDRRVALIRAAFRMAHRGPSHAVAKTDRAQFLEFGESEPSAFPLAWDGRLDSPDAPSAKSAVESLFRRRGVDGLASLRGDFAFAIADEDKRELILMRDSVGTRPLYYADVGDRVFFSSEIKALLGCAGVSSAPDFEGMADILLSGSGVFEGTEKTAFTSIRTVPPGEALLFSDRGRFRRRFPSIKWGSPSGTRDFGEAAAQYRSLFEQAVNRRTRGRRVAVSVSGGLDSSAVFAQAVKAGARPLGLTLEGVGDADESAFLVALEKRFGVSCRRIPALSLPRDPLGELSRELWHGEAPLLDYLGPAQSRLYQEAAESGAEVVLSGHGSDETLFVPGYLQDLWGNFRWPSLVSHLREMKHWVSREEWRNLGAQALRGWLRSLVPSDCVPWLKAVRRRGFRGDAAYSAVLNRVALARRRRPSLRPGAATAFGAGLGWAVDSRPHRQTRDWLQKSAARYGLTAAFPYLDRDLLEFISGLPGDVVNWKGIPRALLREAVSPLLPTEIALRNWKSDYTANGLESLGSLRSSLTEYLSSSHRAEELELIASGRALPSDLWELVDRFALEEWSRLFFTEPGRRNVSFGWAPAPC